MVQIKLNIILEVAHKEISEKMLKKIALNLAQATSNEVRTDVMQDTLIQLLPKEIREAEVVVMDAKYNLNGNTGLTYDCVEVIIRNLRRI